MAKYKSVKEMKEKLYKRTLLDEIRYYGFYIWWNKITDLKWKIPNLIHRAYYGWGKADTWDFDNYLANVIIGGLKHLKKYSTSTEPTPEEFDAMIEGFEANLLMMDDPSVYKELKPIFDRGMRLFHKYFNYLCD